MTAALDRERIVEVRNLVVNYGSRKILNDVSLTVDEGEIFVIMGASGSGKSTLLRHILGLQRAASGCVEVLGREVFRLKKAELYEMRKDIGVAFQSGALFSSLSLLENIELPLRENTELDAVTIGIMSRMKLAMMNLSEFEDLMPAQLSGGMRKRAGLARAVVMDPKLLFFDEPSAGLDPVSSAELDEHILQLRSALGMTIVIVTHELQSALKIADRIMVLSDGEVLANGTVDALRNCPDERVQQLLHRTRRASTPDDDYLEQITGEASDE